jgi:hypothetical protein
MAELFFNSAPPQRETPKSKGTVATKVAARYRPMPLPCVQFSSRSFAFRSFHIMHCCFLRVLIGACICALFAVIDLYRATRSLHRCTVPHQSLAL